MDPLTQAVIGVVAAQQVAKRRVLVLASVLGALSGMASDLDVLIASNTDPLLALEYHRQFTHSLFFIPVGGFLCTLFFSVIFRRWLRKAELSFKQVLVFCTLGYATHGLLDACTTYGTQLLWPLSDVRVAWNTLSIIDPLYTLPILLLVILAVVKRKKPRLSRRLSVCALCWVVAYTVLGVMQRERAEAAALQVAQRRGHTPVSVEAKPSFANILVWKVVYRTESRFYVDAMRVGWQVSHYEGRSIAQLNVSRDFPWLDKGSQQAHDIERFRWFSNDYLAVSPRYPNLIIDMRYSLIPNQIKGMWGIELDPSADKDQHIRYVSDRDRNGSTFTLLWNMILGKAQDTSG
ncbi:MAG: inner membrane protein [Candidatus Endobugula sp.]|jgi:inner membrane protein